MKHEGRLVGVNLDRAKAAVGETVDFARATMGEEAWAEGLAPELPATERIPNPCTHSDFQGSDAQHMAQQGEQDRA